VIPTYLTLFIFGFVYQLVLVYDSLRLKNTIQVIGLCLYNVGMLVYAAVQVRQIQKAVFELYKMSPSYLIEGQLVWPVLKPYCIAIPILIAVGTVALSGVAWKLYGEFAWTIYKHISADLRMKRRFLAYQVRFPTCYLPPLSPLTLDTRSTSPSSNSTSSSSSASRSSSW
jgi:hypothetical protein